MEHYDVIIIGGGPAGLTAALYLARARYRVLVMEKEQFGGQITITAEVVNYPGVPRTSGRALTEAMRRQAAGFGAEFLKATAEKISAKKLPEKETVDAELWVVRTERGEYGCFGLLAATGAHPRMVGFEGEERLRGRGVAYCATCDGEFFSGKEVFVVGGGFAAAEESVFLTKYARHVTILVREPDFTCAKATADAARQNEKITVLVNTEVEAVTGDALATGIRYVNRKSGEHTTYTAPEGEGIGVFVFAGYEPATGLFARLVTLDEQGYIVTDKDQSTSAAGIYAAGDVCRKSLRQVVTAVGDGATAATELEKYAAKMQKKTGILPGGGRREPRSGRKDAGQKRSGETDEENKNEKRDMSDSGEREAAAGLFDEDTLAQLRDIFQRMESPLILEVHTDTRPVSDELIAYMDALAALTEKLSVRTVSESEGEPEEGETEERESKKRALKEREEKSGMPAGELPCVKILRADGKYTGLAFHGVPGGHEFTSFILAIYNAAGPGQKVDEELEARIKAIDRPIHMKIIVSLSCNVCPELVAAAQRIAAGNPQIAAEVYDFNHFPQIKEAYHVMSVPCLVVNEAHVTFGKKTMYQLLDLLEEVR